MLANRSLWHYHTSNSSTMIKIGMIWARIIQTREHLFHRHSVRSADWKCKPPIVFTSRTHSGSRITSISSACTFDIPTKPTTTMLRKHRIHSQHLAPARIRICLLVHSGTVFVCCCWSWASTLRCRAQSVTTTRPHVIVMKPHQLQHTGVAYITCECVIL